MSMEIGGSVDVVIGFLWRLGTAGDHTALGDASRSTDDPADGVGETTAPTGTPSMAMAQEAVPGERTEARARDLLLCPQPAPQRLALQVW